MIERWRWTGAAWFRRLLGFSVGFAAALAIIAATELSRDAGPSGQGTSGQGSSAGTAVTDGISGSRDSPRAPSTQ